MGMMFWSTEVGNVKIAIVLSPQLSKSSCGCVHLRRCEHGIYGNTFRLWYAPASCGYFAWTNILILDKDS